MQGFLELLIATFEKMKELCSLMVMDLPSTLPPYIWNITVIIVGTVHKVVCLLVVLKMGISGRSGTSFLLSLPSI